MARQPQAAADRSVRLLKVGERVRITGYQSDVLLNLAGHELQAIAYDGIALVVPEVVS